MSRTEVMDRRTQMRAWYRDTARKLPRKVVGDVTWLLDQLDLRDDQTKELVRLDAVCLGLADHLNKQSEQIAALKTVLRKIAAEAWSGHIAGVWAREALDGGAQ